MICQECNQRPATLHFTKILNGEKTEIDLCEKCAQEKGEMFMINGGPEFTIHSLLAGLLNVSPSFPPSQKEAFQQEKVLQCESCSLTYSRFVKAGRFGCADCYENFQAQLKPILKRLHSGNWTHSGKIPKRIGGNIHLRKNIENLKQQIRDLITNEEFEKAAEIRDEIRSLEKRLSQGQEGGE